MPSRNDELNFVDTTHEGDVHRLARNAVGDVNEFDRIRSLKGDGDALLVELVIQLAQMNVRLDRIAKELETSL